MTPTLPPFIQELFDRGLDPLADPRTEQWLDENPRALEAFAATRRSLAALQRDTPMPATPKMAWARRALPWVSAAAVIIALGAVTFSMAGSVTAPPAPPPTTSLSSALPRPDFSEGSAVVYSRVATTERKGTRLQQQVVEFQGARAGPHRTLERRVATSRSMQIDLPDPAPTWSVACLTEQRILLP